MKDELLFTLHAKSKAYQARLRQAENILQQVDLSKAYVSFSAGKDSAVIAHLAQALRPGIPILMSDPGCPIHWTEAERSAWLDYAAANRWNIKLFPWQKYAEQSDDSNAEAYRKRIHDSMFIDLNADASQRGLNVAIWGLRADESKGRRMTAKLHGPVFTKQDGTTRCCPIMYWTVNDVWAYIINHQLPILSIYEKLGPQARNGLIGRNGIEHGRMMFLRRFYPDAFRYARDTLGLDYAQ